MINTADVVEATAKVGLRCQVEGYHHAYSSRTKREAKLYLDNLCAEILTLNERDRRTAVLSQMGNVACVAA